MIKRGNEFYPVVVLTSARLIREGEEVRYNYGNGFNIEEVNESFELTPLESPFIELSE